MCLKVKCLIPGLWLSFIMQLMSLNSSAQVQGFIPIDETMQSLIDFYNTDTLTVIIPDDYNPDSKARRSVEGFSFWRKDLVCEWIHESAFREVRPHGHLQYFGPINEFNVNILGSTPFTRADSGFVYHGRRFVDSGDAFYYMHPSGRCIYTCTNRRQSIHPYTAYLAGGAYPLYIFSGNQLRITGFDRNDGSTPSINDLDALRNAYFCKSIRSRRIHYFFPCSQKQLPDADSLISLTDTFVEDLCRFLQTDTSGIPLVTTYIYASRDDLQAFIAAPKAQTVYGKSHGNINHSMSLDMAIVKHETGHSIIESKIGKNHSAFFSEGFRQYTDYLFSKAAYENDLKVFREHAEMLTPSLVLQTENNFFSNMVNYSISGIFVKRVIEITGLEQFKKAYADNDLIELIEAQAGPLEALISELKDAALTPDFNHQ